MKNNFTLVLLSILLCNVVVYSQKTTNNYHSKWTKNPFDHQVFIANMGQFDGSIPGGEKILYGVQLGSVWAYFTSKGVVYKYIEIPRSKEAGEPDMDTTAKRLFHYLNSNWEGANPHAIIETVDKLSYYYTYPKGNNSTIKTNIFKKIIYKNIYPGIDIEYFFPEGKEGIEYSIIVHPDADISHVKLSYPGISGLQLSNRGDIDFNSEMGEFTDHAPIAYYKGQSGNIPVSYLINGSTESFSINKTYDKTKTLVIDPWITDPLFTKEDRAYDLDWDIHGNVYAYGGFGTLFQLVKMNSAGTIQWTYNASSISDTYYGDVCTDKATGTCYLIQGFNAGEVLKVNSNGSIVGTFTGSSNLDELWRAEYDAVNNDIVIAGGGTAGTCQAGVLDTNMTSINPVNVLGTSSAFHDMCLLALDPSGTQCYMATARSYSVDPAHFNNVLMQLPLPSLSPTAYYEPDYFGFVEVSSVLYAGGSGNAGANTNAMNGAAASLNWLYLYDGDTLKRFNKKTGAFISQVSLRKNNEIQYGGLDVDLCDNLVVGVADSIYVLDSAFTITGKISLPDTVYDIHIGANGALYACGKGYVTQLVNPLPDAVAITNSPSSCSLCTGSATVSLSCNASKFSYQWSNGATTQTISNLCPGTYTVTLTDTSAHPTYKDSEIVVIQGGMSIVTDSTIDNGGCNGSAWVNISGGTSPYTFAWSQGATTDTISNVCAGSYCCTVTDANGCSDTTCVTVTLFTGTGNIRSNSGKTTVYPNPNNGTFTVTLQNAASIPQINIYNVLGQEIYSSELNSGSTQINLANKAAGIYFYRIITESGKLISDGKMVVE